MIRASAVRLIPWRCSRTGKFWSAAVSAPLAQRRVDNLVRLDPITGAPDSWDPIPASSVIAIALQADGKILAGGFFNQIGGQPRNLFARLSNDTAALSDLVVTQNSVTWVRGGASTQFSRVRFESSTDNIAYTALGEGTRSGSNWNLSGLNLPIGANTYVRARGYYGTGDNVASESVQESVRRAFFTEAAPIADANADARRHPNAREHADPHRDATTARHRSPALATSPRVCAWRQDDQRADRRIYRYRHTAEEGDHSRDWPFAAVGRTSWQNPTLGVARAQRTDRCE